MNSKFYSMSNELGSNSLIFATEEEISLTLKKQENNKFIDKKNHFYYSEIKELKDYESSRFDKLIISNSNGLDDAVMDILSNLHVEHLSINDEFFNRKYNGKFKFVKNITVNYLSVSYDFSLFPELQTLHFTKSIKKNSKVDGVGSVTKLIFSDLKLGLLGDINLFANAVSLEELIVGKSDLRTLSGVESLISLKSLEIMNSPRLAEIDALTKLNELSSIRIVNCKKLVKKELCELFGEHTLKM